MFKIDRVRKLLDCDLCNQLLVDPVTIACGYSLCKSHLDVLLKVEDQTAKSTFTCEICHKDHVIPYEGFIISRRIEDALEIELNNLKPTVIFNECKQEIIRATENLDKIGLLETNSEFYVSEYFDNIKKKVEERRNYLKKEIDTSADELILSMDITEDRCLKLAKTITTISQDIVNLKHELRELKKRFDTLEISDKKFENIKKSVVLIKEKSENILSEYNYSLLENKEYSFACKKFNSKKMFGNVQSIRKLGNSKILQLNDLEHRFKRLCENKFSPMQQWRLLYRATRDGFESENFHLKCDGVMNTLTVIKTTSDNIFGAFVEKKWDSTSGGLDDAKAFIFSLKNQDGKSFIADCTKTAMFCDPFYGPSFGGGFALDIYISSNSSQNRNSHSNFGYSYDNQNYERETDRSRSILGGSYNFKTVEIEVFAFKNKKDKNLSI